MAANDIETKVEAALATYLADQTGYTVYRGLEPDIRLLPAIFCHCASVVEAPIGSGNYQCDVAVVVISKAQRDHDGDADPLLDFRARLATIRDILNSDDLTDSLSAAEPDFSCMFALDRGGETAVDADNFVATIRREIHACGTAGV